MHKRVKIVIPMNNLKTQTIKTFAFSLNSTIITCFYSYFLATGLSVCIQHSLTIMGCGMICNSTVQLQLPLVQVLSLQIEIFRGIQEAHFT